MNSPRPSEAVPAGPDDADPAPEVPPGVETLEKWDEPPAASGHRIQPVPPEDESETAGLVQEGIEEADRELRLEAETDIEDAEETDDTNPPTEGILS